MNDKTADELATLEQLAHRCGILPDYSDVWGSRHQIPAEIKRELLSAMGLPGDDAEAMAAVLREMEDRPFAQPLEPVAVIKADEGWIKPTVTLALSDDQRVGGLFWRVVEEGGSQHGGPLRAEELSAGEARQLDGRTVTRHAFDVPVALSCGYHVLSLWSGGASGSCLGEMSLIVTPPACYTPDTLKPGSRAWCVAVQLYGLTSGRNWGVGDFTDLRQLVELCAGWGAEAVALNPLHALFPHNPQHDSPYSPSSRLHLNVMNIDVEAIPEFASCAEARSLAADPQLRARLEQMRQAELVDYRGAGETKRALLEALYAHFVQHHVEPKSQRGEVFAAFVEAGGEALRLQATHEALQEHFYGQDQGIWGWPLWPEAYRDAGSAEVATFAEEKAGRIQFFQYLQWVADEQLAAVAERCRELDLALGLYRDLSVSVDRAGAEVWANREAFAMSVSVGAPPDALGPQGQNWGLPPLVPERLRELAYRPFVAILRRNMRHAGALRIDHVMGLMRLFWIPQDHGAADGAYVRYPLADLLGIVALESQRNRCLVIGEDLGTVPDEVRHELGQRGVLSYRLAIFEKGHDGAFLPPEHFPEQALVAATTHDLPTVRGYWEGRDLALRDELDLFPSVEVRQQMYSDRAHDRTQLLSALQRSGNLPEGMTGDPAGAPTMTPQLARALQTHLAQSPSRILVVQLEDLLGQTEQINLPGTFDEHPNWKRRIGTPIEALNDHQDLRAAAEAIKMIRPPVGRG